MTRPGSQKLRLRTWHLTLETHGHRVERRAITTAGAERPERVLMVGGRRFQRITLDITASTAYYRES